MWEWERCGLTMGELGREVFTFAPRAAYEAPLCDAPPSEAETLRRLHSLNEALYGQLNAQKERISQHHHSRKWDRFKKCSNAFELVSSPGIAGTVWHVARSPLACGGGSADGRPGGAGEGESGRSGCEPPPPSLPHCGLSLHAPISRSFFKLFELLGEFHEEMGVGRAAPMRAAFLAEGPGGFVEAFATYRGRLRQRGDDDDDLHGITLISRSDRRVPVWNATTTAYAATAAAAAAPHLPPRTSFHGLRVHRGVDGTGDLYSLANIDHFVHSVGGPGCCDLVTADGGFDFSIDFNTQEERSAELLCCEVYAALRLLRRDGAFVLKVYDLRYATTARLLHLLRRTFRGLHLCKPLSSRPANSEKYVVCTGFEGCPGHQLRRLHRDILGLQVARAAAEGPAAGPPPLPASASAFSTGAAGQQDGATASLVGAAVGSSGAVPTAFLGDIVAYNVRYTMCQTACIARTLAMIRAAQEHVPCLPHHPPPCPGGTKGGGWAGSARDVLRTQMRKSIRWCRAYGIPVSRHALASFLAVLRHLERAIAAPPPDPLS